MQLTGHSITHSEIATRRLASIATRRLGSPKRLGQSQNLATSFGEAPQEKNASAETSRKLKSS